MAARRLSLYIGAALEGKKVNALLRRELQLSGSAVRRAKFIPQGITLDDTPVFTNAVAREGQVLSVQVGDAAASQSMQPMPGPLSIAYEDEDLLILDKQAPLAVHPSPGRPRDTLANYLQAYYQDIGLMADYHPVNRLDRGTSGLMAVAKHAHAHERLQSQLHGGSFFRVYLAVCEGRLPENSGLLDLPIGRAPGSVIKREVRPDGAAACTHYKILAFDGRRSLVALRLETGRTHQIRVHLSHLGCPLVGDFLYGQEAPELPDRFALHSHRLRLCQPVTGAPVSLAAPLPQALSALLDDAVPFNPLFMEDPFESA